MNKVPISENFIVPTFQTVNKNQQSTQLILMDPENGQIHLLHQYYCTRSQDYGNLIALLQTQAANDTQCPYVLNPVVYLPIRFTNAEFQTSHFVQVLYEYGSHTLAQEMYLRIQQKNYFEQHEIWSILGSCVFGLKSLKDKQFSHSSICLNDIFVTKSGEIKLSHPMLRTYDHYFHHNGQKQTINEQYLQSVLNQQYYFSPQQLSMNQQNHDQSLIVNENPTIEDFFKCDIFSLGMSVLALCLLQPIGECYVKVVIGNNNKGNRQTVNSARNSPNASKWIIDSNRLEQCLYALQNVYSNDLIMLLSSMLTYQPLQRICIDQLALIIQQMIQANNSMQQQLQQQQFNKEECYNYYENNEENSFGNSYYVGENINYNDGQFKGSNKVSPISMGGQQGQLQKQQRYSSYQQQQQFYNHPQNHQQLLHNNNKPQPQEQMSTSKFGKFSRVSQASPISGRKTKYSSYKQSIITGKKMMTELFPCQTDQQDRPSPVAMQCMNDVENIDKPVHEEEHMVESQRQSFQHYYVKVNENKKIQNNTTMTPTIKSSQSPPPPSTSSINQTLKQYINHESESSVSQVNQTRTYEEYNKAVDAKLAAQPKQVISVMTSKQLCSLPSDSISIVEEHAFYNKTQYKQEEKENQMNLMNNNNNIQVYNNLSALSKSNVNNQSNSYYVDLSNVKTQNMQPLSARNFNTKGSTNKKNPQDYLNKINQNFNNIFESEPSKNSFTISLSKDYENLLKQQKQNPNSMYTDPKFLQAIRQDVNKILTKRGLQVTSSRNSMKQENKQIQQNNTNKPVFINGKKVNDNAYQPIYSPYKPYEFQSKPIFYR